MADECRTEKELAEEIVECVRHSRHVQNQIDELDEDAGSEVLSALIEEWETSQRRHQELLNIADVSQFIRVARRVREMLMEE